MIERGLITAAIVVVLLGVLAEIGEQASNFSKSIDCAFAAGGEACAPDNADGTDTNEAGGGDTRSTRDERREKR